MEKLSYREQSRSRRSFGNPLSSPRISQRNSDIDFNDVFGGPPRTSFTERRESVDSNLGIGSEESRASQNPRSAPSEKPVFGGESPRRKHLSNDFFDDIFDSSVSTPRKPDREVFSSTPASRILSPTHPLPPNREPFVGASSLPANLSLSSKLPKGTYLPTFCAPRHSPIRNKEVGSNEAGYPSSPSTGGSRLALWRVEGKDDSRNHIQLSYRHSHLFHEFSLSDDRSTRAAEYDIWDKKDQSLEEKNHGNLESSNDNNQFHFSIYKWASKGVMLMVPARRGSHSNPKESRKIIPAPVEQVVNLPSVDDTTSTANNSSRFQCDSQDDVSSNGLNMVRRKKENQEAVLAEAGARPLCGVDGDSTAGPEKVNKVQSGGRDVPHGISKISEKEVQGPELKSLSSSNSAETELQKPELKTLGSFLSCGYDEAGKENVTEPIGQPVFPGPKKLSAEYADGGGEEKKPIRRKPVTKPMERKPVLLQAEATNSNIHDKPLNWDYDVQDNRPKGKVKEFVKIFNQEPSSKLTHDVDTRSHSSRKKESGLSKKGDLASIRAIKVDRQENMINKDNRGILTDTPSMVDQIPKQTAKIHPLVNADGCKVCHSASERNGISDSSPDGSKDALENIEDYHCEDLLHMSCLVEELPVDEKENPHPQSNEDDIQIIDSKIRQWSHAKEGNIRSLLSTLQYVLWPGSGWKPVPLVDIIEGSSVRRAYQKALLCLHPDKLQQRGAAVHQKYIAEKVFDILQEAWTHFTSVSPI